MPVTAPQEHLLIQGPGVQGAIVEVKLGHWTQSRSSIVDISRAQTVPGTAVFAGLSFLREPCLYDLSC